MPGFKGQFVITPPLTETHRRELQELGRLFNSSPAAPHRRCQWVPTQDGSGIEWDGGEKFWAFEEWLAYLIEHYLAPWGYRLSGEVAYDEEYDSFTGGVLTVTANRIAKVPALIANPQHGSSSS